MVEAQGSHGSMLVTETNKLIGISNYYTWKIKMKVVLRKKIVWDLIEKHVQLTIFLTTMLGVQYIEQNMKRAKNLALSGIQLLVTNNLLSFVSTFANLALAWDALYCKFTLGNQSHLLMLTNQLHTFKMLEGGSMEKYANKTMDLKNKLLAVGEVIPNKYVCQLVFNGLPRSYEKVAQTLSNMDTIFTFDQLITRLMAKITCQKQ
jgi:hypothetical protein